MFLRLVACVALAQASAAKPVKPVDAGTVSAVAAPAGNPILEVARKVKADAGPSKLPDAGVTAAPKGLGDGGAAVAQADAGRSAPPMAADVAELVGRMQAFYEKTQDFTAGFRQDYFYKAFKRTQTSTGRVVYRKPALMRWDYEQPSARTFVLAGERVYAHDPEAKLLTRASIATNKLSASVTFLWGQGRLADEFSIAKKACETCAGTLLELTPLTPDPRFKRVLLEVDPKTAQVLKSTVVDPDGSENAISFLALKTNTGVDEKTFKLTPPPGTQVQDFLTGGAGIGAQPLDAGR